jgi:hypothetical protein
MQLNIERGIIPEMMKAYEKAAHTGGSVTGDENRAVLKKALSALKDEFAGADSEKGLAALRNAIARSYRSAVRDWTFTSGAKSVARGFLGPKLDGKGGSLATVEQKIRNSVHSSVSTASPY